MLDFVMFLPYPHRGLARFRAKNPIFACFPLSRPISDCRLRSAAATQTATSRGNTRPTTNRRATPEDKQKNARGGRRHGSSPRAAVRHKSRHGRRPPIWMQDEDERWFYVLLCLGDTRAQRGGVREVGRGAVEDIERRELLFV